jgi:hypothetical protein
MRRPSCNSNVVVSLRILVPARIGQPRDDGEHSVLVCLIVDRVSMRTRELDIRVDRSRARTPSPGRGSNSYRHIDDS